MFAGSLQESTLVVDARHASRLSDRITHLRELIVVMVDLGRDTHCQSELLFRLLREFRATRLAERVAQGALGEECLPLPAPPPPKLDA